MFWYLTRKYLYERSGSLSLYPDKWIHELRIRNSSKFYNIDCINRVVTILPIAFYLISGEECRTSSECNGSKGLCCKLIRRARSQPKKVRYSFLVVLNPRNEINFTLKLIIQTNWLHDQIYIKWSNFWDCERNASFSTKCLPCLFYLMNLLFR